MISAFVRELRENREDATWAMVTPMIVFVVFFALVPLCHTLAEQIYGLKENAPFWLREPSYWVYPLQTLGVGLALWYFWRTYPLPWPSWQVFLLSLGLAAAVFVVWFSPKWFFGAEPRTEGFDPTVFEDNAFLYWGTLIMRFARLVLIVPVMEEIFWRGWLQRALIEQDVDEVPIGKFTWLSLVGTSILFGFAHFPADFFVAVITGLIWGWLICYTRNLVACIISHAVINLALGIYVLSIGEYGYL